MKIAFVETTNRPKQTQFTSLNVAGYFVLKNNKIIVKLTTILKLISVDVYEAVFHLILTEWGLF